MPWKFDATTGGFRPYDSAGNPLHFYGIFQSTARTYLHVCYDDYFGAPVIIEYLVEDARHACLIADINQRFIGSISTNTNADTGAGFNLTPEQLQAKIHPFTPNPEYVKYPQGKRAELDARDFLENQNRGSCIGASVSQQIRGIDIIADSNYEVKSRAPHQRFLGISIQTHERNDDRRIS